MVRASQPANTPPDQKLTEIVLLQEKGSGTTLICANKVGSGLVSADQSHSIAAAMSMACLEYATLPTSPYLTFFFLLVENPIFKTLHQLITCGQSQTPDDGG